jgi:hypothetical protein
MGSLATTGPRRAAPNAMGVGVRERERERQTGKGGMGMGATLAPSQPSLSPSLSPFAFSHPLHPTPPSQGGFASTGKGLGTQQQSQGFSPF